MDEDGRIPKIIDQIQGEVISRRQDVPPEYTMNGALYLFRWEYFKEHGTVYGDREKTFGYVMDRYHSLEIDEPIDFSWAEFLIQNGHVDLSPWQ